MVLTELTRILIACTYYALVLSSARLAKSPILDDGGDFCDRKLRIFQTRRSVDDINQASEITDRQPTQMNPQACINRALQACHPLLSRSPIPITYYMESKEIMNKESHMGTASLGVLLRKRRSSRIRKAKFGCVSRSLHS